MPYIEFDGKTADNAVQKACNELNLKKERLEYDVISYGSTGIFGLVGTKKARIRVSVPDNEEKQNYNSKKPFFQKDQNDDFISDSFLKKRNTFQARDSYEENEQPSETIDELAEQGFEALKKIINAITTDAVVTKDMKNEKIIFNVKGGNAAILIGKRGQTLEAMQYLVDKVVNKKRYRNKIRVRVDVEGYLEAREESLTKLAVRLGEKVKRSGRPTTLNPMNAHDRRIIHIALKNDIRLRTQSMGTGYYRKLVIFPQRRNARVNEQYY
ncbi:spoIIIJ-associated protein [Candidatus Magnetomoraceae bacterium gMMP-15]